MSPTRRDAISQYLKAFSTLLAILTVVSAVSAGPKKAKKAPKRVEGISGQANVVLWSNPTNIRQRNLFSGPGGEQDSPQTSFTFVKEDLDGTSPKLIVLDQDGVKWKAKLGPEAQPETVATRLVWAVGYWADEDYFLPLLHVEGMPAHLHRGQNWIGPKGTIRDVRLERYLKDEKKVGNWKWRSNPFSGTRELNGLRVIMALINNWDVKNDNNAIYDETASDASKNGHRLVYSVSDLGASFGSGGRGWTLAKSRNNLKAYGRSKFVRKVGPQYVDFNVPTTPPFLFFFNLPEFILQRQMGWVCKHIPRADARWIGNLLAQLSPDQVRAAFRAAGYTPEEVEDFTKIVKGRIAELNKL